MIELDWVKQCVRTETYFYSAHADTERLADNLTLIEIEESVQNGIILEQYADTGRGPSCLIAGFTALGKPVHISDRTKSRAASYHHRLYTDTT